MSWNITRKCNLKCSHCYINATTKELKNELTTYEAKNLIDQISEVSRPLLILSGGEPLLRSDVFELIKYGVSKGLKMGLGSNGSLIDSDTAHKLKQTGILKDFMQQFKNIEFYIGKRFPQFSDSGHQHGFRAAVAPDRPANNRYSFLFAHLHIPIKYNR